MINKDILQKEKVMLEISTISQYLVEKYRIDKRFNLAKRIEKTLNDNVNHLVVDECLIVLGFKEVSTNEFLNILYEMKWISNVGTYLYLNLNESRLTKVDINVSLRHRQLYYHSKMVEKKAYEGLYKAINVYKGRVIVRPNRFLTYLNPYLNYIDEAYINHHWVTERLRKCMSRRNKTMIIDVIDYLLTLDQDEVVLGLLAKIMYLHDHFSFTSDQLFVLSAKKNNPFIQYEWASECLRRKEYETAMYWFERSASNGYVKAILKVKDVYKIVNDKNLEEK